LEARYHERQERQRQQLAERGIFLLPPEEFGALFADGEPAEGLAFVHGGLAVEDYSSRARG